MTISLSLKFPYNQYQIAPFLMTSKALVRYMAISLAKEVKPLIYSAIKPEGLEKLILYQNINHENLMDIKYLIQ